MSDVAIFLGITAILLVACTAPLWLPRVQSALAYDRTYDRIVRNLIAGNMLALDGSHTVRAGALVIWVSNYPYAYGYPYCCGVSSDMRLSPRTKRALRDHVTALNLLAALEKVRSQ